jgi:hypothetical protein
MQVKSAVKWNGSLDLHLFWKSFHQHKNLAASILLKMPAHNFFREAVGHALQAPVRTAQ